MKKICFALTLLLCCGSAFAFDPVAGDITTGFSRDDRLEIVKDDIYRLMWQDQQFMGISVPPLIVTMGNKYKEMTYDEAVEYCDDLNFAGFDDWHLPTVNELLSITDDTRFEPAINKAFKNIAYETNDKGEKSYGRYRSSTRYAYRSSTRYAYDSSRAWLVDFWFGGVGWSGVSYRRFVRCVRDY